MSAYDEPESAFARACREEREEEARAKPRPKKPPPAWNGRSGYEDFFSWARKTYGPWTAPPPPRRSITTWRTALGFAEHARPTLAEAKASYRALIRAAHPDRGGTTEQATALNLAWERARAELRATP